MTQTERKIFGIEFLMDDKRFSYRDFRFKKSDIIHRYLCISLCKSSKVTARKSGIGTLALVTPDRSENHKREGTRTRCVPNSRELFAISHKQDQIVWKAKL